MEARDVQNKVVIVSVTILVVVLLFFPFTTESLWWRQALNSGHTFFFLLLSFFLYYQLKKVPQFSETHIVFLSTMIVCGLLAVLIELVQGYFHNILQRESSFEDLYKDSFGIIAGLSLVAYTRQTVVRYKLLYLFVSLVFVTFGTYSFLQISWHSIQRANALPLVTQYDANWMASFSRLHQVVLTDVLEGQDGKRYRVRFDEGKYPGIEIIEPVHDWRSYERISFYVWSDNESDVDLMLRIHDAEHNQDYSDRYNKRFVVHPGENNISVDLSDIRQAPVNRELSLNNVAGLKLFMIDVKESVFLELSNIYFQ